MPFYKTVMVLGTPKWRPEPEGHKKCLKIIVSPWDQPKIIFKVFTKLSQKMRCLRFLVYFVFSNIIFKLKLNRLFCLIMVKKLTIKAYSLHWIKSTLIEKWIRDAGICPYISGPLAQVFKFITIIESLSINY